MFRSSHLLLLNILPIRKCRPIVDRKSNMLIFSHHSKLFMILQKCIFVQIFSQPNLENISHLSLTNDQTWSNKTEKDYE